MMGNSYRPITEYVSNRQDYQANSSYGNGRMTQTSARDRLYRGDATGDYGIEGRLCEGVASLFANIKTINLN